MEIEEAELDTEYNSCSVSSRGSDNSLANYRYKLFSFH